jgi:hypothetical protein
MTTLTVEAVPSVTRDYSKEHTRSGLPDGHSTTANISAGLLPRVYGARWEGSDHPTRRAGKKCPLTESGTDTSKGTQG